MATELVAKMFGQLQQFNQQLVNQQQMNQQSLEMQISDERVHQDERFQG